MLGLALAEGGFREQLSDLKEGLRGDLRGLHPSIQPIGLLSYRVLCFDDATC